MDGSSSAGSKLSKEFTTDNGMYAKLRRLKIQEEILSAVASKSYDAENFDNNYNIKYLDLRKYITNIKKMYAVIRNLFDDVQVMTKDHENLKNIDVDDIKKDIFDLDEKIKSCKDFLRKEMCLLKVAEKELIRQIQDNPVDQNPKLRTKVHLKPHYNEVVVSPVRAIITSPFKCVEVQRFQNFMKNSFNRYGGWDEYNHNVFVNIWNRHYGSEEITETPTVLDVTYARFRDEVIQKIHGVGVADVTVHAQWYIEYIKLKKCQELALSKWRENKRKIKNIKQITKEHNGQNINKNNKPINRLCKKEANSTDVKGTKNQDQAKVWGVDEFLDGLNIEDYGTETLDANFITHNTSKLKTDNDNKQKTYNCIRRQQAFSTLYKPTKQWNNRCQRNNDITSDFNIKEIKKLKTPLWRIGLK